MGRNRNYGKILSNIQVDSAAAEGVALARHEGKVIFVKGGVPGDVAHLKITGRKKKFLTAEIVELLEPSEKRTEPFCEHFGTCGGCKWQHMQYVWQLHYKALQVKDNMERIGGFSDFEQLPILGPEETRYYRNKMDYAFSQARWLSREDIENQDQLVHSGLGFHVPGRFDKVLHVNTCHLMHPLHNEIREFIYAYALEKGLSFFHLKESRGLLRNLVIRNTRDGQWMLILLYFEPEHDPIRALLEACIQAFPQLTSLYMGHNPKANDAIYDIDLQLVHGKPYLEESLDGLIFRIQPKSFFQTNPSQAEVLYREALKMADIQPEQTVYDLYCGTGTISLFLARSCSKVIGIESVPQAIADAEENAQRNQISNCHFVVGDMRDVLTSDFFNTHGKPDVIITDPPRAGMHPKVVQRLLESGAERIVYVSCNPATQARDLQMLQEGYRLVQIRPVDMFPHTHHVENIALLLKK